MNDRSASTAPDGDANDACDHRAHVRSAPDGGSSALQRRLGLALLVAVTVLGAWVGFDRATAAFGNSDEGLNSSVWAMCSRSLRDDPTGSALGGRRIDGVDYATHPPLMCSATAALEAVAGEHEWVTRAPAWLSTFSLVPLLYVLLRRMRLDAVPAAAGTAVAVGSPMVLTYGSMLDTPVLAVPFAVMVAIALTSELAGSPRRAWPVGLVALSCAAAGLVAWQAGVFAFACAASTLRWGRNPRRAVAYAVGALVGLTSSVGWGVWTYGSLDELRDKFSTRTTGSYSLGESLSFQVDWLLILLGVGVFALVAGAVALTDREWRPIMAPALATFALWGLVFHSGAGGHQYWNYFVVLPLALGGGWGLARLGSRVDSRDVLPFTGDVAVAALAALAVLLAAAGPSQAAKLIDRGHHTGELLREAELGPGDELAVVGADVRVTSIVVYYTGRSPIPLDRGRLESLAADDPNTPVLIALPCPPDSALCRDLPEAQRRRDTLTTAGEIVATLPGEG